MSRIIPPVLIGVAAVMYLLWKQFDPEQFAQIKWNNHTFFWLAMAVLAYVARHIFYAYRLHIMTDKIFNWVKSIELIFIWEFSSAVSPTMVGGSAVALFLLAQEKISSAKTVSVVLYTVLLDTLFFLISLPILLFTIGPLIVRPDATGEWFGGYMFTVYGIYLFLLTYALIFFYGLFINPKRIRSILFLLSKIRIIKRFKEDLVKIGKEVVQTSNEMGTKPLNFHLKSFGATSGAWIMRFLAINFIIIALVSDTSTDFITQYLIYGRGEMMHTITQFSPTPGAAGVSELMFGGFYSEYVPKGISLIAALVWRLITYYPYLLIGVIIIPNWIRKIMNRRRRESLAQSV